MTPDSEGFAVPEVLVEHARRFYAEGGPPVPPRVAATVLLLRSVSHRSRSSAGGAVSQPGESFEVYVIRRVAAMAFGGMYAFPGGGVDPSDSHMPVGWAGPSAQQWGDRLGLPPEAAQAVVCAAAREVFEESGVLLAGPHPGSVVGDVSDDSWESARRALVARERFGAIRAEPGSGEVPAREGFAGLLAGRGLTVRSDLLVPWSRWITPEFEPRRFDTYFFVALLPNGQRTRNASGEADHAMWIRPADAVARAAAGEIAMLPPTLLTLREVAACADWAAVSAAAAERDVATPIVPRLEVAADGTSRLVLP